MDHKDLDVWKESMLLAKEVYLLTKGFPKEELYGITSQIRRASVSVPSNIAEGAARSSDKEFIQFLYISLGSISELETQLLLSRDLGFIGTLDILPKIELTKKKLLGLIKYLKNKPKKITLLPLTTHYSSFTTHYSSFTIQYSPFTTQTRAA